MIVECFPGLAQLYDVDKMTLLLELWKDVMGVKPDADPAVTEFVEQNWLKYKQLSVAP